MKQFILGVVFVCGVSVYASQKETKLITKNWIEAVENILDAVENREFFYNSAKNIVNKRLGLFERLQDDRESVDFFEEVMNFRLTLYKKTEKAEREIKNYVSQTRETCYELIKEKQNNRREAEVKFLLYLYRNRYTISLIFLQNSHSAYLEYLSNGRDGSFIENYYDEE